MENQHTDDLSRILRTVEEILEIVHFMKDHRSQLEGDPILDFAEVCQLLRQSERQVRRFREQGLLIGFNIGARRSCGCRSGPCRSDSGTRAARKDSGIPYCSKA